MTTKSQRIDNKAHKSFLITIANYLILTIQNENKLICIRICITTSSMSGCKFVAIG